MKNHTNDCEIMFGGVCTCGIEYHGRLMTELETMRLQVMRQRSTVHDLKIKIKALEYKASKTRRRHRILMTVAVLVTAVIVAVAVYYGVPILSEYL